MNEQTKACCNDEDCCNERPIEDLRPRGTIAGDLDPARKQKMRPINIEQLDFGFVIRVGCQTFAIEKADKLITALAQYMKDPETTEKEWFEGKLFAE